MKPTVLFIYKNKNLADVFAKHFRLNGYELYQFYDEELPQGKLSKLQRLENIFHRIVLRDTSHIHKIQNRNFNSYSIKKLEYLRKKNLKFDYCFVIRGDLVHKKILQYARSVSHKMIDYQLDGLSVSSGILAYQHLFDQIFVFDPADVIKYREYNLKFISNCYFGEPERIDNTTYSLLYLGQYLPARLEGLASLHRHLAKINYDYTAFTCLYGSFSDTLHQNVRRITDPVTYEENIELVKQSAVLVDFRREEHTGLSLRFFEALQFGKKVITNNSTVKNYDFYHPDNVFVTDFTSFEGLDKFLTTPYLTVSHDIIQKYAFNNWIKEILQKGQA